MSAPFEAGVTQGEVVRTARTDGFDFTETSHQPNASLERHIHARAAVTVPLRGGFLETIDGIPHDCRPGAVLLKGSQLPHENRFSRDGSHALIIELPAQLVTRLSGVMNVRSVETHLAQGAPWTIGLRIYKAMRGTRTTLAIEVEELVAELLAECRDRVSPPVRQPPPWLRRVRERIEASWTKAPLLADLAAEADVHPVYLARAFRECFGCSIGEYVHRRRTDHAIAALVRTRDPIGSLAVRLGYYDQSHFTRRFRQAAGCPPGEFRAACRRILRLG